MAATRRNLAELAKRMESVIDALQPKQWVRSAHDYLEALKREKYHGKDELYILLDVMADKMNRRYP